MNEVAKCRRDHNRLGFAYQIGFARLFNRFPAQQPLEINDELLSFVAVQMNIDSERISDYASWQHTVSEHQARIQYLGLRPVCAQPGRHSLKPTLKGYFYANLVGTLIKTFLLIECGMAVLSPLLNAVISDGNHTHHHRRK